MKLGPKGTQLGQGQIQRQRYIQDSFLAAFQRAANTDILFCCFPLWVDSLNF